MRHLIRLDPKFFMYHEVLAELYIDIGYLEEATDTLAQATKIDGTYAKFYYLMGKVQFLRKDYASAISQFKRALAYNPLSMSSLCYLATIYNLEERYQETTQLLAHFDLKYHNNTEGEAIFNNKIVALLNTNAAPDIIQRLVNQAHTIRPSSLLIKELYTQLGSLRV